MAFNIDGLLFVSPKHYDILDDVDRLIDEMLELGEREFSSDEYKMKFKCYFNLIKSKLEMLQEKIVVYERKTGEFFDVFYCISDLFSYSQDVEDEIYPYVKELLDLFNSKVFIELTEFDDSETDYTESD